ncbi:DUF1045 domain-containing protein [Oceanibium sediminis]|uniref:DUF1045 domain-containing protein n=1 Tax=Oceanibium sediminis TaxID=2026339 RepID=UPI000DD4760A|nr:DUF1045 domain-containing protein [Oceanibium sediminis]
MSYTRFAIYYLPPEGPLGAFGAAWLGWDVARGRPADQLDVPDIGDVTMTPRKYGFHATLKPPFKLAAGQDEGALAAAVAAMAADCPPVRCDGLQLSNIGRFLALTPSGDCAALTRLAEACVRELDAFRAPPAPQELQRRRDAGLNARQEELLTRWGYPYVMEEFRFHMTLTGSLEQGDLTRWRDTLAARLPALPEPFYLDAVALVGERSDGMFELIQRYVLSG